MQNRHVPDGGGRVARRRRLVVRGAAVLAAVAAAALATAPTASAVGEFDVTSFDTSLSSLQAGAYADQVVSIAYQPDMMDGFPFASPAEGLRSLVLDLPPGQIGNIAKFPACPREILQDVGGVGAEPCPEESQVGSIRLTTTTFGFDQTNDYPIYNMEPGRGQPARLAMVLGQISQPVDITVRTGDDYGLRASTTDIPTNLPFKAMVISLWGVPADPSHDALRFPCGSNLMPPGSECPSSAPRIPFMQNPTDCTKEMTTTLRVRSYHKPNDWIVRTSTLPAPTGCDQLTFEPTIDITAVNPVVDEPTAVTVGIQVPENTDPDGLSSPALRRAIVQMPKGMTINPALAFDRTACSDGAFGLRNDHRSVCPADSKIGSFGIDVPALRAPLPGDIYLGEPTHDNPFRLFLFAEGQGVRVKLEGSILPDPETGQITAVFDETPQVPFRGFQLRFVGGQRSALLMPRACGTSEIRASFTPYSSSTPASASHVLRTFGDEQGGSCDAVRPFKPSFTAGVTNAGAGEDTGFTVAFGREDGHQMISRLNLQMPAGLLGRLSAVPLCPNEQADRGTCSEESLVGGTIVSAGSGDTPLTVPGRVYLTAPPKPGQIAGLSIVVPAIAGPYDLGTAVVRAGITVNPDTSLTVESDPLPTMLSGIELRIKRVIVNMDRPGFMLNPTDCSPKKVTGSLISTDGVEVGVGNPFGVRGCANLPLEGKVAISTKVPTKDGGTTGLTFNLGGLPGHSNVRQVQVVLPSGMGARLDGPLQAPCTESDFAADACMESARVGVARATTPVLPEELSGNVYFIENPGGNALPRLGIRLKGAVTLDVIGDVEVTRGGRVVTTFPAIPDVPISDFVLDLDEGRNAVLSAAGLCGKINYANVDVIGHSGKQVTQRVPVAVEGCRAASSSKAKTGKKGKKGKNRKRS